MKKGMSITTEDGLTFNLVDSVNYAGSKYFAAVSDDETDENLYFFKQLIEGEEESLELIDPEEDGKIIDALMQHIENTF